MEKCQKEIDIRRKEIDKNKRMAENEIKDTIEAKVISFQGGKNNLLQLQPQLARQFWLQKENQSQPRLTRQFRLQ